MGKKLIVAFLVAACIGFIIAGTSYMRETGLLKKRPDAQYLTAEEEAVRPVYRQLTKKEKAVYTELYRGMQRRKEKILLPKEIDGGVYSRLYCLVEKQEGELFFADSTYYTAKIVGEGKIVYRETGEAVENRQSEMNLAVRMALNMIKGGASEHELASRIHDYLIKNCTYITGEDEMYSSTAYGCLVENRANCEGYAKAFDLLAAKVGLNSVLVTGRTDKGENHAWNQVMINGKWYNLDVTWDDTDVMGDVRRTYFLVADTEFGTTHFPDRLLFDPFPCTDESRSFYVSNGLIVDSMEKAEDLLIRELSAGKEAIELKFKTKELYDRFKDYYINEEKIFDLAVLYTGDRKEQLSVTLRENEMSLNMTVYVKWQ